MYLERPCLLFFSLSLGAAVSCSSPRAGNTGGVAPTAPRTSAAHVDGTQPSDGVDQPGADPEALARAHGTARCDKIPWSDAPPPGCEGKLVQQQCRGFWRLFRLEVAERATKCLEQLGVQDGLCGASEGPDCLLVAAAETEPADGAPKHCSRLTNGQCTAEPEWSKHQPMCLPIYGALSSDGYAVFDSCLAKQSCDLRYCLAISLADESS